MLSVSPRRRRDCCSGPRCPKMLQSIFERYASDPEVTRYLGWPRHTSVEDTQAFVAFSQSEWARSSVRAVARLSLETRAGCSAAPVCCWRRRISAQTGYVFARDAWGQGYATEALGAMVSLAAELKVYAPVRARAIPSIRRRGACWRSADSHARGSSSATRYFRICRRSCSTCSRMPERSYALVAMSAYGPDRRCNEEVTS